VNFWVLEANAQIPNQRPSSSIKVVKSKKSNPQGGVIFLFPLGNASARDLMQAEGEFCGAVTIPKHSARSSTKWPNRATGSNSNLQP
jgi:hypothetical protein